MTLPYQRGSETSRLAASEAAANAANVRRMVFETIVRHPGLSDEGLVLMIRHETGDTSESSPGTWRARRIELEAQGLIERAGQSRNVSGLAANIYRSTGRPYPDPWPSMVRAGSRTPRQWFEALDRITALIHAGEEPFGHDVTLLRWVREQLDRGRFPSVATPEDDPDFSQLFDD